MASFRDRQKPEEEEAMWPWRQTGMTWPQRLAKEPLRTPGTGKGENRILFWGLRKECSPADTGFLTSGLQNCESIHGCCFKPPRLWQCYSSLRKLIQWPTILRLQLAIWKTTTCNLKNTALHAYVVTLKTAPVRREGEVRFLSTKVSWDQPLPPETSHSLSWCLQQPQKRPSQKHSNC